MGTPKNGSPNFGNPRVCWTISLDPHGLIWGSLDLLWFISGSELQPKRMTRSSLHVLRTKLRKPRASYDGLQGSSIMPDAWVMIGTPRESSSNFAILP